MKKRARSKVVAPETEQEGKLLKSSKIIPLTQSLDLATHPAVTTAWEHFFATCWDWWEEVERRRKRAEETRTDAQMAEQPTETVDS